MANNLNRCEFIGRLGSDPELRYTQKGDAVSNFTLAVNDYENGTDVTEWVKVTFFGKLAEVCGQYLKKGSHVYVAGKWKTRSWEKDGQKRYSTELKGFQLEMLGGKQESAQPSKLETKLAQTPNIDDDFDVPF